LTIFVEMFWIICDGSEALVATKKANNEVE